MSTTPPSGQNGLKACPFCGSRDHLDNLVGPASLYVSCTNCGTRGPQKKTWPEADAAWDIRPASVQQEEVEAACARLLEKRDALGRELSERLAQLTKSRAECLEYNREAAEANGKAVAITKERDSLAAQVVVLREALEQIVKHPIYSANGHDANKRCLKCSVVSSGDEFRHSQSCVAGAALTAQPAECLEKMRERYWREGMFELNKAQRHQNIGNAGFYGWDYDALVEKLREGR